jgi:hypothetical protein
VKIEVAGSDTTLRPGMTTANEIVTATVANALFVPLEAVFSEGGYQYVYKKDGGSVVRQMIDAGTMNDNEIIVRKGLAKDDVVYLTPPADTSGIETEKIEGLKPKAAAPDTPPTPSPDSAKSITMPAKPAAAGAAKPAGTFTPIVRPKS